MLISNPYVSYDVAICFPSIQKGLGSMTTFQGLPYVDFTMMYRR